MKEYIELLEDGYGKFRDDNNNAPRTEDDILA